MKLSVSLPDSDVAALDEYVRAHQLGTRSAGVQHAIRLLRHPDLEGDYTAAWDEWDSGGDEAAWAVAAADGIADAAR